MKKGLEKLLLRGEAIAIPLNFFNSIDTPFNNSSLGETYDEDAEAIESHCSRLNENCYKSIIFYKNITSIYHDDK